MTSTTSNRKRMSGLSSIRSQARAPREMRCCFSRSTASKGRPKSSPPRVFTSTNTSVSLSRQTMSISPPVRPRKLRNRTLYPLRLRYRRANLSPRAPRRRWPDSGDFLQREKRLCHRFERSAMDWARAEFMEFQQMQFGSVAFVLVEAILRELGANVTHHPVASYLGEHARCSDVQTDAVAVNNRSLRKWERNNWQSIDQNMLGRVDQRRDCQAHRSMARAQNVDAIDLNGIDSADHPSDFGIGHQI